VQTDPVREAKSFPEGGACGPSGEKADKGVAKTYIGGRISTRRDERYVLKSVSPPTKSPDWRKKGKVIDNEKEGEGKKGDW